MGVSKHPSEGEEHSHLSQPLKLSHILSSSYSILPTLKLDFCCSGTFPKSPLAGFHPEYLQLNKIHGMKESIQSWKGKLIVWDSKCAVCLQHGSWSRDRHDNGGTRSCAPLGLEGLEKGHRKEELSWSSEEGQVTHGDEQYQ